MFTALHTLKDLLRSGAKDFMVKLWRHLFFRNYVMHENACLFLFLDFREEHSFSGSSDSSDSTKGGCALFI